MTTVREIESFLYSWAPRELAESCYNIPDTWPHRCIDWEQAADELCNDYSTIDIGAGTYLWR